MASFIGLRLAVSIGLRLVNSAGLRMAVSIGLLTPMQQSNHNHGKQKRQ